MKLRTRGAVLIAISIFAILGTFEMKAQSTTLIFIRHGEKATGNDPELSEAGWRRAQQLVDVLSEYEIAAVYSTPFKRTQQTVDPLSQSRKLSVTNYPPSMPYADLILELKSKHVGKTIVIAGHSNTVPGIVDAALGRPSGIEIGEEDYDNLIIVTLIQGVEAQFVRTKY